MDTRRMRRDFAQGLMTQLRVVWPILSGLLLLIVGLGLVVGWREGWTLQESVYFAFVSGLTIGYGDFAPAHLLSRACAIGIGLCGVLFTALLAAVAVRALADTNGGSER